MKIERGLMTIEDTMDRLVETEQGITCGCENPKLKATMFMDGVDYYQNNYACRCGNQIVVFGKRSK